METTTLLDKEGLIVADVRCGKASVGWGPEEVAATTEVAFTLSGFYEREVRRPGRASASFATLGDPTRIQLFYPRRPYRVAHPAGGRDRSLTIGIADGWRPPVGLPDDRPSPSGIQVAARRLARALTTDRLDRLEAEELAGRIVDRALRPDDGCCDTPRSGDVATARLIRIEVASRPGERASLAELGRRVALSGWEAARRFRRATGGTIAGYRTALRVAAALERVEAGESDLTLLALDLGFADHSHLTNVLRRVAGRPPSAFRRPPTSSELAALRTILQA